MSGLDPGAARKAACPWLPSAAPPALVEFLRFAVPLSLRGIRRVIEDCTTTHLPRSIYDLRFSIYDTPMINLKVNGKLLSVDVDPDTPLLWVLRETLALTGTKYGCGMALCGACTVHLNGEAIRSCVKRVADAAGKEITTIEGLSADLSHPLQKAWIEVDVPQCGYCQSGQIMSAAVLLSENPAPSDNDIDEAMTGNICRCGTYSRIRQAIHRAAEMKRSTT